MHSDSWFESWRLNVPPPVPQACWSSAAIFIFLATISQVCLFPIRTGRMKSTAASCKCMLGGAQEGAWQREPSVTWSDARAQLPACWCSLFHLSRHGQRITQLDLLKFMPCSSLISLTLHLESKTASTLAVSSDSPLARETTHSSCPVLGGFLSDEEPRSD